MKAEEMRGELLEQLMAHYYNKYHKELDDETLRAKTMAFIEGYGYALTMMGLDGEALAREGARRSLQQMKRERIL